MARAKPSAAAVKNVLDAMLARGLQPGAVQVAADGSFSVETLQPRDRPAPVAQGEPRKFGQTRAQ
ncbi:hypothetical protein PSM7751_01431 [Pseudooceanicola marinus]|uniref:Uncharacterized protein n=1 Tax=Pseudooceanicola marinus TaxID=396013 RepID=A0A1X6YYP7_9RHOB|nr:hypothetical protein [Pseudooceanicola marinus]PJE32650.1 hypothetical protein CVM50_07080 [Pseudooceanicola marinus]SLN34690.1 hypothetical protein PSM7751_01431 [Pseudooceanicola marinus]